MSHVVQIPWTCNKETEQAIIKAEVIKIVLRNICRQHRYFQNQWQTQHTEQILEIQQLVQDMMHNQIFATNRKEQITIAIHCLFIWLNNKKCSHDDYLQVLQWGPQILTQLESKTGNRFFHDIRIYRCRQLLKIKLGQTNKQSVRCYLIESHTHALDYNYTDNVIMRQCEEYNFPDANAGKTKRIIGPNHD